MSNENGLYVGIPPPTNGCRLSTTLALSDGPSGVVGTNLCDEESLSRFPT